MFVKAAVDDTMVILISKQGFMLTHALTLLRAKNRVINESRIRNPVYTDIDGVPHIFTRNEWENGHVNAVKSQKRSIDLMKVIKSDLQDKRNMSPKLSKQRDLRYRLEADAEAENKKERAVDEYLTVAELSDRIKMAAGTIRNMISRNVFVEGIHYIKPSRKKVLFIWSAVSDWLHSRPYGRSEPKGRINIS